MAFWDIFTDPIGTIVKGIGAITGIVKGVGDGISSVIDASGIASLLTAINTITSSITDLVGGVTTALGGIIDPILNVVNSVEKLSSDIENKIISPIIRPIVDTVTEVKELSRNIDRLVGQGLSGIIEIPKALADSLGSIEAGWERATKQLAEFNAKQIKEVLVPGIIEAVSPGLASLSLASANFTKSLQLNPEQINSIPLPQTFAEIVNQEPFASIHKLIQKPDGLGGWVLFALVNGLTWMIAQSAALASQFEEGITQARMINPTKILGPGEALSLGQRGILSRTDMMLELRRNGFNDNRALALEEGAKYLPTAGEAIEYWRKGIITEAERDSILTKNGFNRDAILAAVAGTKTSIGEETLLTWLAKDFINLDEYKTRMFGKGYSDKDAQTILSDALQEPQVNTAINWYWNELAGNLGWFPDTYKSGPPKYVVDASKVARIDPVEVTRRWQSQFAAMPISTAITLFFRGELGRKEVEIVVQQNGFPRDMTDMFIKAQSPLLPARSVPSLVAKGELSIDAGMNTLQARGYSVEDASLLLAAAKEAITQEAGTSPTEETKITAAQSRNAYKDGLIEETTLRDMLKRLGLSDSDIDFMIIQDNFDLGSKFLKDEIDTIKAEVSLGSLTVDEAIGALFDLGLSEPEVTRIAVGLKQTKRANAKTPDLGLLKQMAKASLISQEDFAYGVAALGYDSPWLEAIIALQFGVGELDNGSSPTEE